MADHPDRVPGSAGRRFRWGWVGLLVVCCLIAAVPLTAVAYPFRYVNDWMPLTTNAKAVALAHEAHAVAASIREPLDRGRVLVEYSTFRGTADVLARAGRRSEATQVAREALALAPRIPNDRSAGWYLVVVVQTFVKLGEPTQALSIARSLRGYNRVDAFASIIDAEVRARRTSQAAALMPELMSAVRGTKETWREGTWDLRNSLQEMNVTLVQAGLRDQVQIETGAILALMEEGDQRDTVREGAAEAFARAGQTAEALSMARATEEPWKRAMTLAEVAQELARGGRREDALAVIEEALAAARALSDADFRASALAETALALVDAGRPVVAVNVAREARETVRGAEGEDHAVVVHVARALAYAGRVPEAVKAVLEVRDRWGFDDPFDRLVNFLILSRRPADALAVAEAAPINQRVVRLNRIARALVKDGQKAAAIRLARAALDLSSRVHETALVETSDAAVTLARAGAKAETRRVVRQALLAESQGRGYEGSPFEHRKGLMTIAEALAVVGARREAMNVARRAQDLQWPDGRVGGPELEVEVIADTAEAGAITAAVDLARAIRFPAERAQALIAVASVILHDGPFLLCCGWMSRLP